MYQWYSGYDFKQSSHLLETHTKIFTEESPDANIWDLLQNNTEKDWAGLDEVRLAGIEIWEAE